MIDSLINRFNLENLFTAGLLESLLFNLYSTYKQLKLDVMNRKAYIEFSNGYFLFLAKINAKTNSDFAFALLKLPCQNEFLTLLQDFSENFIHIENYENKKLANFFFANIIKYFYASFSHEALKKFTVNMVKNLSMFNKDLESKFNDNLFDISNDMLINSNKFNQLANAKITVNIFFEFYL